MQYESWALVESVRTERGPRQRTVATIGKLPGMDAEEKVGWEEIGRILDGKPGAEGALFERESELPSWATVNLKGIQVERLRHFGDVYLGLALWKRLGLSEFCEEHIPTGREEIPWSVMAAVLVLARFCAPSSELQIAESWYSKTAIDDLLGVPAEKINDDRLYRALDALLPHKDALCLHLQKRYGELFGISFEFLLYDITSAYFEGGAEDNSQAKRGYSRDSRPDCVQICIGLVVSVEGLPLAFEVFDGNRTDVTTVQEMIELMQKKYGVAERVWVMDRGMVSEDNLEYLRSGGSRYLVGTPKAMLRKFEAELLQQSWQEVQPGVEVKLCPSPEGMEESFVLCRSEGRRDKETAILDRFICRLETGLNKLKEQAEQGRLRDRQRAERRIGRLLEKNSRAASLFDITVQEEGSGAQKRLTVAITKKEERYQWLLAVSGVYLLRTNWTEKDPREIWKTYIQLTQVEDAFRITKSDLGLRPIYHQKTDRTQAHILVCFLALALWRTLQQWMSCSGLGAAPRKLLEELREIKSLDVVLPARDNKTIRLRIVSTPPPELRILLQRLRLPLPNRPKILENVVPTFAR
ncbi:MAG: IS1634 family transposase [Nitrospirales bacterium]|nr:IS1634 family transposase [Nitrospirales bacterium]